MQAVAKDWGLVRYIHRGPFTEVHHASIKAGGVSTHGRMHHHEWMTNDFYIVSGVLLITEEDCRRTLQAGEHFSVPPGRQHRFEAVTDVELIEIYHVPHIDTRDIVRAPE